MAATLICLGAGAGLQGEDLRQVRGSDVHPRSGGLVVEVGGARSRVVPVLQAYHDRLAASVTYAGEGYVFGGETQDRKNVTTPQCAPWDSRTPSMVKHLCWSGAWRPGPACENF